MQFGSAIGQMVPHPPQFDGVVVLTSQPFAGSPSQLENPAAQAPIAQVPLAAQTAVAFASAHSAQLDSAHPVLGLEVETQPGPHNFCPDPHAAAVSGCSTSASDAPSCVGPESSLEASGASPPVTLPSFPLVVPPPSGR